MAAGPLPDRIRHRFPIFERLVYINSCSQGALSDAVRQSYDDYLRDWDEEGAPWEYWVERTEAARGSFARLVNAEPDEIAVTTSVSAGVSALASGLRYGGRSKIVLSEKEFPTVGQIWHAQESRGARVVHAHPDDFDRLVDDDTAVVSLTHISFRTGEMYDPRKVADLAHKHGALMLLDAYQSVGSVPVDVKELDVDFLAAGALKYLLASAGLGFFYCRRELWERAWPTATGWFADQDIFKMDASRYAPSPTARRFQSGTPPIPAIYAGIAGIELMQEIGIEETRGARPGPERAPDRGDRGTGRQAGDAEEAASPRRADLREVERRERARRRACALGNRHLRAGLEPPHLGARVQLPRGHRPRARGSRPPQAPAGLGPT